MFRRDLFYKGLEEAAPGVFSGTPPDGAFYAFVKINAEAAKDAGIAGDVAVVGDGRTPDQERAHRLRARRRLRRQLRRLHALLHRAASREELTGALASMKETFARVSAR